ncbi:pirin family protein [Labilibacter marinus]|uniref:pirin family protein n=1 Tax=Labilibacter marinus TaxID=1477105 RepID=UPI000830F282|nr:pirin family protein [Labilibacter marinus]
MKVQLFKSEDRGHANHGWLDARHSFSFANYYDPKKVNFGALRVLNDDTIAAGAGFPEHPHDNMEIITIPLSGMIAHKDSMGNQSVIKAGEIQVMSAGSGIFHSEFNNSSDEELKLFQIWLFPKVKNVEPRYDQISISTLEKKNELFQILSPNKDDDGVWIHQDAWFNMGNFEAGKNATYNLNNKTSGVYLMLIEGEIKVADHTLTTRDAIGITEAESIDIETKSSAKLLLMEIPMNY